MTDSIIMDITVRAKAREGGCMKKTTAALMLILLCLVCACAQALEVTGLETDVVDRAWETNAFFSRMEALTGIAVSAHGVNDQEEYGKLLSALEKGEAAADVLFKADLTRDQEYALIESGAVIDLAPLIDAHMPNLSALFAAHPAWKEIVALEDGRIASLPLINEHERQAFMWINAAWLEKLGIAMPQTLEELTAALEAMAAADLNGNGKRDERAADLLGVYEMRWLLPYFGIVADDYSLARNAQGEIVFAPELPEYRAFIELLKDWYARGILTRSAFTDMHSTQALAGANTTEQPVVSGMMFAMTPYTHGPVDAITQYEPLLLAGPNGKVRWRDLLGEIWTGCFAVTSRCKDPAEALRWADALYGEAGALLAFAGLEGEDYTFGSDGKWAFKLTDGRTVSDIRSQSLIYTGVPVPGLYPAQFIFSVDSAIDNHVFAASERVREVSERVTQPYALDRKAQARAEELAAVLGGLVDTGIARFAMGEVELTDETYAAWLEEMKAAGSGELAALFADAQ